MLETKSGTATWTQRLSSSFRYRGYRQLFAGSMLAQTVFRMNDFILGWQMLQLTNSAFWVGLVAFASGIPLLIFSPFTGMLADQRKRQHIVAMGLVGSALAILWLTWLSAVGRVEPLHIVLVAFLVGTGFTLYAPARLAMLPNLVPGPMLRSASTLEYSSTRLVGFFGPVLAGFLVERAGIPIGLLGGVILLLLSVAVFMRIDGGQPAREGAPTKHAILIPLREALSYIHTDRPLWSLILLGLVMVPIGMVHQKMLPVFVQDVLGAGAATLGLMVGLFSMGAALAGIVLAGIGPLQQGRVLLGSALLISLGVIVFAFTRNTGLALTLALLLGVIDGGFLTLSNVVFQTRAPDSMRGRVLGAWGMVWGILPFTALLAGLLTDKIGVVYVIAGSGALCLLFTLGIAITSPHLRELG